MQEFEEQAKPLPQHLKDHAPRKQHTEEQLAYVAADMYHATRNIGKMLASLNRLSSIQPTKRQLVTSLNKQRFRLL